MVSVAIAVGSSTQSWRSRYVGADGAASGRDRGGGRPQRDRLARAHDRVAAQLEVGEGVVAVGDREGGARGRGGDRDDVAWRGERRSERGDRVGIGMAARDGRATEVDRRAVAELDGDRVGSRAAIDDVGRPARVGPPGAIRPWAESSSSPTARSMHPPPVDDVDRVATGVRGTRPREGRVAHGAARPVRGDVQPGVRNIRRHRDGETSF